VATYVSGGGGLRVASYADGTAMAASQAFPMSTGGTTGHLYWTGPNSPTVPWMPNADGVVTVPGIYCWRFRYWTQTAPAASNLKFVVGINGINLAQSSVYQVDDLTFAGAGYRPSMNVVQAYSASDATPYQAPYVYYIFSAADATGVLKYDMACWRLAY